MATLPRVLCARCQFELPPEAITARDTGMCPACNSDVIVRVFPALFAQPATASPAEMRANEGEATCFFHPGKAAVTACAQCGRFLCRLCKVDFRGEEWCPECFTSAVRKKKLVVLENRRTLHDSIALALATLPLLTVWLSLLGAPIALFVAIRYWKTPGSIVRRNKIRSVLAILLAVGQLAGWVWLIVYMVALARART